MFIQIKKSLKVLSLVFFACFALNSVPAFAETYDDQSIAEKSSPESVIRNFYTQLLATMEQGDTLGFSGRFDKLSPVLNETFDFRNMARLSVGREWNVIPENEQNDLVKAFANFSIATYAARFSSSSDSSFNITGTKESGDNIVVETILEPSKGNPIVLNYLMHKTDNGQFRIIDVLMGGVISELAAKRSEFSAVIRSVGVSGLIDMLNEKAVEMPHQ